MDISIEKTIDLGNITIPVLKGDKGDQGIQGIQGEIGPQGEPGQSGTNGTNGLDAKINGYNVITIDTQDGITFTQSDDEFTFGIDENYLATKESVDEVKAKIPTQASLSNQLADKNFVNSSIATATANFLGTFESVAEMQAYSGTKTINDYAYVKIYDTIVTTQVKQYDRYKWNGTQFAFEYTLNNSSFTANQWASINSGATAENIEQIGTNAEEIDNIKENYAKDNVVEHISNKINTLSSSSTNAQYPSAKAVYDYVDTIVGNIGTLLDTINGEVI